MAKKHKTKVVIEDDKPDFDDEPQRTQPKIPTKVAYLLNQDEVNALIKASNAPLPETVDKIPNIDYPTYNEEETLALINGARFPSKKKKKKEVKS